MTRFIIALLAVVAIATPALAIDCISYQGKMVCCQTSGNYTNCW